VLRAAPPALEAMRRAVPLLTKSGMRHGLSAVAETIELQARKR